MSAEILRLNALYSQASSILSQLRTGDLQPTPENASLCWQILASFNYFPGIDPPAVQFWLSLLPRAIRLVPTSELICDENVVTAVILVCHTAIFVAHFTNDTAAIDSLLGLHEVPTSDFSDLQIVPFFPIRNEFLFFLTFQEIHGFSIPSFGTLINRSLLVASLHCGWRFPQVDLANSDYLD
jgi:hypothetical protein